MAGAPDAEVSALAQADDRILVTLDLDFANILQYPPGEHRGIIVLRAPRPTRYRICEMLRGFVAGADERMLRHSLVILEPGNYRVRRGTAG